MLGDKGHANKYVAELPPDSPLRGRPLGSPIPLRKFWRRWEEAFDQLCGELRAVKRFRIRQGAVIERTDGRCFQIRNFDTQSPWMKGSPWQNIRRVYRSPLHCLKAKADQYQSEQHDGGARAEDSLPD